MIRRSKTVDQLAYAKALQALHIQKYSAARTAVLSLKQLSISYPRDHILIIVDDMDNKVSKYR